LLRGCLVHKPHQLAVYWIDQGCRQILIMSLLVKNSTECRGLFRSGDHKDDLPGLIDDRQGQGDPFSWRLGSVEYRCHPFLLFLQDLIFNLDAISATCLP